MKRLLTLALTSVISVSAAFAAKTITPSVPALDSDGCYAISTAEELYGFVKVANSSSVSLIPVCAKLTADIVVNENVLVDGALNGDGSGASSFHGLGLMRFMEVSMVPVIKFRVFTFMTMGGQMRSAYLKRL